MSVYARRPVPRDVNKILIFFLVVFVLATLGATLWGYYGYQGQDAINASAKKKSEEAGAAKLSRDYFTYLTLELRLMLNDPLEPDDRATWQELGKEFAKGKFDDQKNQKHYSDLIKERRDSLGFDEINDKYLYIEKTQLALQEKKAKELKAELNDKSDTIKDFSKTQQADNQGHDKLYRDMEKLIQDKTKEILDANLQKRAAMEEAFARNSELMTSLAKDKEAHEERERQWFKDAASLKEEMERLQIKLKEAPAQQIARNGGMLMLDVSMGKPLWDTPLGKIIAINGDRVLIHVFTDDRAEELLRTGLTFNVFAPGKDAMADGRLKGTIEIISLEGGKAAIGRVTARFGGKDNPIFQDDLLFNTTWGTHVAVVGQVNLFRKYRSESQAEQARNLKHFLATLERQGVIVDAYVDLTDSSIKGKYGKITEKTRYLIRGYELDERKAVVAALANAPDTGDKDKNKVLRDQIEADTAVNIASINKKIADLQKEAVDKGLFIISPENFANVSGYRKLGGYGSDEVPFTPTVPAANSGR